MITFTFNGLDFSTSMRVNEIKGRGLTPSEVSTIAVPGMTGVHKGRKTRLPREITIKFTVIGNSLTDLRNKINLLSERLDLDEVAPLVFSDEPDKTYFAIMQNASDDEEIRTYGMGTLTFFCPDPYKYGPEMTATLNSDVGSIINVAGTAPTRPIIELTATAPSTYAMVVNDKDEYNMVGSPTDVDTTKYVKLEQRFYSEMNNLTGWTTANPGDVDHTQGGTVHSISAGGEFHFTANGYGTNAGSHGPAIKAALPETLQDFRIEARAEFMNKANKAMLGNLEMYALDVNGNCVARIGLRDSFAGTANVHAQGRIGHKVTPRVEVMNTQGDKAGVWNDFDGVLRIEREGKQWTFYVAKVDAKGNHHSRYTGKWYDSKGVHQNAISQIVFAFQQHGSAPVPVMRFSAVRVYRINAQPGAEPYIVYENDTVTFDHTGKGTYLVNGEDAKAYKNFGAIPFELQPGSNTIAIEPGTVFTGTIRWRDAYK